MSLSFSPTQCNPHTSSLLAQRKRIPQAENKSTSLFCAESAQAASIQTNSSLFSPVPSLISRGLGAQPSLEGIMNIKVLNKLIGEYLSVDEFVNILHSLNKTQHKSLNTLFENNDDFKWFCRLLKRLPAYKNIANIEKAVDLFFKNLFAEIPAAEKTKNALWPGHTEDFKFIFSGLQKAHTYSTDVVSRKIYFKTLEDMTLRLFNQRVFIFLCDKKNMLTSVVRNGKINKYDEADNFARFTFFIVIPITLLITAWCIIKYNPVVALILLISALITLAVKGKELLIERTNGQDSLFDGIVVLYRRMSHQPMHLPQLRCFFAKLLEEDKDAYVHAALVYHQTYALLSSFPSGTHLIELLNSGLHALLTSDMFRVMEANEVSASAGHRV